MNSVKYFASAILLLIAVAGCATPKEIETPDGEKGHSISCDNSRSWDPCFSKASKICGGSGYEIISKVTGENPVSPSATRESHRHYARRILVIKCV